jgi:hypothetical protein
MTSADISISMALPNRAVSEVLYLEYCVRQKEGVKEVQTTEKVREECRLKGEQEYL